MLSHLDFMLSRCGREELMTLVSMLYPWITYCVALTWNRIFRSESVLSGCRGPNALLSRYPTSFRVPLVSNPLTREHDSCSIWLPFQYAL